MVLAENRKILVVDDEQAAREQVCKFLRLELDKIELKQASDGMEALKVCRSWQPHVVMSDINMSRMDGLEMLRQIKHSQPEIQVIIFTGREDSDASIQALRLGASDYLRKPLDMEELVLACRRALDRSLMVHENIAYKQHLEEAVRNRTRELHEMNKRLLYEIEERKLATRELKRSEERYLLAQRAANIGSWEWDVETDEIHYSETVGSMFELPSGELSLKRSELKALIHPEDWLRVEQAIQECLAGRAEYFAEYRVRHADGSEHWVADTGGKAIGGTNGRIRMYGVVQDITERKVAEEARLRLSIAVDHLEEGIAISDTQGRIQYVNPAFEHITGYTSAEVIQKVHRLLDGVTFDVSVSRELWLTIESGQVWRGHVAFRKKDQTQYEVEIAVVPIRDQQGRICNYVSVMRDVTEEIALQRKLRQAQKMEAIGSLAGGIAHDFNNILFAIQGFSELTAEYLEEQQLDTSDISEVLKAVRRAKDLVQQILTFSRQSEQERVKVLPSSIVKEVLKLVRASLPASITISKQIDAPDVVLMADPIQLHQILMNLCTNAWHAMAENGGELHIGLRDIVVDEDLAGDPFGIKPGAYVILSVSDTGVGIPEAIREKIFDPFFTTKAVGLGTGLGLSVVHGIVTGMDGLITVQSAVGEGTTFNIYMPCLAGAADAEASRHPAAVAGTERVLLVDDEPQIVLMLNKRLQRLGYQITACTRPSKALALFEETPGDFDVAIVDLVMPQMSGEELAVRLLRIRPDLPVILCTGFGQKVTRERAHELGIRGYLLKPVVVNKLCETMRRLLDGGPDVREAG